MCGSSVMQCGYLKELNQEVPNKVTMEVKDACTVQMYKHGARVCEIVTLLTHTQPSSQYTSAI